MDASLVATLVCLALISARDSTFPARFRASEKSGFSADWAAFQGEADSGRVEFFYSIPYDRFEYVTKDDRPVTRFSVRFEIEGAGGFREQATIYKQASPGSTLVEAARAERAFVDGFSVHAPLGRHRFRLSIATPRSVELQPDSDTSGYVELGSIEDSVGVPSFSGGLAMSSLQMAASVAVDTATGGFSVIPNPTRRYGARGLETVYFYYEGYNFEAEPDSYLIRTAILSTRDPGETLAFAGPDSRVKRGSSVSGVLGMGIRNLAPGEYELAVELRDLARDTAVQSSAGFRIGEREVQVGAASLPRFSGAHKLEMSALEQRHYRSLEYVATPREIAYYNSLSDSGKEAYLGWFWSRHSLSEFARRMETAQERYRIARTSGLATDRGRIYVKYGEPDEVERAVLEMDRRSREYWQYYNLGLVFVFIDVRGDNNYRLAYSNSPEESATGYEQYLTPDEEEQFR